MTSYHISVLLSVLLVVDCSQLQETKRRSCIFVSIIIQLLDTVKIRGLSEALPYYASS